MHRIASALFALGAAADFEPPTYTIDLDGPAEHHWDEVCADHKQTLNAVVAFIPTMLPSYAKGIAASLAQEVAAAVPEPFKGEMAGLARCTGAPLSGIGMLNIIYSLVATGGGGLGCTGIVADAASGGGVLHGRNLDFDPAPLAKMLRNATVTVRFTKGGAPLYTSTTFAGLVGEWTGQRPGAFTVEGNERDADGSLLANAAALRAGALPPSMLLRQVLEEETTYAAAVARLASVPVSAPVYYIVGGTKAGEGAVVTRERNGTAGGDYRMTQAQGWYIVETNYDHWKSAPGGDDRRDPAIKAVAAAGEGGIAAGPLYDVLSVAPVKNERTIFSVVQSAAQPGVYRAAVRTVRDCGFATCSGCPAYCGGGSSSCNSGGDGSFSCTCPQGGAAPCVGP